MEKDHLFELAESYISQTGISVFLTGRAGTGKTTFLKYIVENTPKRCVVLAPTGVAAINAGGVTIHSFFQLPLCPYLPDVKELVTEYQLPEARRQLKKEKLKIIKTLDLLIIDEISMVRADLLDAVDAVMRRYRRNEQPFGGVQLLMIGDAHQLPPVVTEQEEPWLRKVYPSPFFFHSKVMQQLQYVTIELQRVYRQSDYSFLQILNNIRDGVMDNPTYRLLNSRLDPRFDPDDTLAASGNRWIRLTTHNRQADNINQQKMESLKTRLFTFYAEIEGNFPDNSLPAEKVLQLKEGAQVMFLKNDSREGRYYNGKIATVTEIDYDDGITVTDENGDEINVPLEKWENIQYEIDKETKEIVPKVDGTFTQYPLRAAWAVTIHKSQGLTFEHVIIDAASAFTFGQVYVALSRCRTLEGIVLSSPISQSCLFNNSDVSGFHEKFMPVSEMERQLEASRAGYFMKILKECFTFRELERLSGWVGGIFRNHLINTYPEQTARMEENRQKIRDIEKVAEKFRRELDSIGPDDRVRINERVSKAAGYFLPILIGCASEITPVMSVSIDNKEVKKSLTEASDELLPQLYMHLQSMKEILETGFSIESYLRIRNDALLSSKPKTSIRKIKEPKPVKEKVIKTKPTIEEIYSDNRHPELIQPLIDWRTEQYMTQNIRAYWVLTQRTLLEIADTCPTTKEELLAVNGFGPAKWKQYGEEILNLIKNYRTH
jgi:hypothetical protein